MCQLLILPRFFIIFLEKRLVKLLTAHFLFMSSSLWCRSRRFWDECSDARSPTDRSPTITLDYQWSLFRRQDFLGAHIHREMTTCNRRTPLFSRHHTLCHFLMLAFISKPLPTSKPQSTARCRNERRRVIFPVGVNHST